MEQASSKIFLPQIYVAGVLAWAQLDLHEHELHLSANTEIIMDISGIIYQIPMKTTFFIH